MATRARDVSQKSILCNGRLTVSRSALTLAVITVVIAHNIGLVNVNSVRDSFAEAVTGERHCFEDLSIIGGEKAHKVL